MGLWLCSGLAGGLLEDSKLFHDVRNAFEYVKGQLDNYCISIERFNEITEKSAYWEQRRFLFENDLCEDEAYYQWIIEEIEIEDAPRAALVTGSREETLTKVLDLMKEGYYPIDLSTAAALTEDPIDRPLLVEYTILMTTLKDY